MTKRLSFCRLCPDLPRHLLTGLGLTTGRASAPAVSTVRTLGAHLGSHMDMSTNSCMIVKACYFRRHHITQITRYLPRKTRERVVDELITCCLDYCNSLLYGSTQQNLDKLQRVQNSAPRLIVGASKFDHVGPVLMDLHWLPIWARIHYKILMLVRKAVNRMGACQSAESGCPLYTRAVPSL